MKESFESGKPEQKKNAKGGLSNTRIAGATALMSALTSKAQQNPDAMLASSFEKKPITEKMFMAEDKKDSRTIETAAFNSRDSFEIKIANYFETDKADISPENAVKIAETLHSYLSN